MFARAQICLSFVSFVNVSHVHDTRFGCLRQLATLKFPDYSTRAFFPFIRYLRPKTLAALAAGRRTVRRDSRGIIFSIISRSMRDTRSMNYNVVEELMPIIAKINVRPLSP